MKNQAQHEYGTSVLLNNHSAIAIGANIPVVCKHINITKLNSSLDITQILERVEKNQDRNDLCDISKEYPFQERFTEKPLYVFVPWNCAHMRLAEAAFHATASDQYPADS